MAAAWAILAPAMYGTLFGAFADWSALFDFLIVFSCGVLVVAAFKNISLGLWLAAFAVMALSGVSGFFYHFQDSGESGPLPFEWLNSYFVQALPLLLIAFLSRFFEPNKDAEQAAS
jgi:hypothetical protein